MWSIKLERSREETIYSPKPWLLLWNIYLSFVTGMLYIYTLTRWATTCDCMCIYWKCTQNYWSLPPERKFINILYIIYEWEQARLSPCDQSREWSLEMWWSGEMCLEFFVICMLTPLSRDTFLKHSADYIRRQTYMEWLNK